MDLWTEFEGVTIDSAFALKKLLQTEGRSAFFSTMNAGGESVLIRIIECHFDEDEILARWRGVQTLGHPNFLRIDRFGQFLIEADDITAVYAVFERVDANLGQVLERGRLSAADAAQIGLSAASALETLHANGFVHEHVEARNLYAVGETVKLRSDCVRETPEGEAGVAARRRDVHDLSVVLMQVLLGSPRIPDLARITSLPAPFEEIVRNGLGGTWGLGEIQEALKDRQQATGNREQGARPKPAVAATPSAPAAAGAPVANTPSAANTAAAKPRAAAATQPAEKQAAFRFPETADGVVRVSGRRFAEEERRSIDWSRLAERARELPLRGIAAGVVFALVALFGWILLHHAFRGHAGAAADTAPASPAVSATPRQAPAAPVVSPHQAAKTPTAAAHHSAQWRVVAFTYNREEQARKKASSLAAKRPDLRPEVFSPSGRAPWLVTVGGAMDRDAAYALARKAGSLGLPRDTYARNYTAR